MTWRDTFAVEQTSLEVPTMQVVRPKARVCEELMPEGSTVCGFGDYCQKAEGHESNHSAKPSRCNRPHAHAGDHMLLKRDFTVLARWP